MGKAGKLKKQAATKRLEVLKKKIKAIAKDELQIKKSGPIGHLGMDEILAEIKTQIKAPKSSNPLAAIQSKSGALENVRDLIETYRNVERMISNFDETRPDNNLTRREMEKIEAWLESIEISTGIAKERPGPTQEEIINRNILARIDKGLKKEVDELEQAIASSPDEFENPAVNLRDAIERAKSKIHRNQQLIAENKKDEENENDDEKEHAILKWEIEINKIDRQITLLLATGQDVSIDSELNTHVAECRTMLEDARRILAVVKDESKPYLSENDRLRINQILAETRKFATGNRTPTVKPPGQDEFDLEQFGVPTVSTTGGVGLTPNADKLDELLAELFPKGDSEDQRKKYLETVAQLAAHEEIDAFSIMLYLTLLDYEKEIPKIFTAQYETLGTKLVEFLKACDSIPLDNKTQETPENVKEAYRALLDEVPDKYKELLPAELGKQLERDLGAPTSESVTRSQASTPTDDLEILSSEFASESTSSLSIEQRRELYLKQAAKLAAMESFDNISLITLNPLSNYRNDIPILFTGENESLGRKLYDLLEACRMIAIHDAFEGPPQNAITVYQSLLQVIPENFKDQFPANLSEPLLSTVEAIPSSGSEPIENIPPKIEPYIQTDLKKYPTTIRSHDPGSQVTIGDLHGNTLKLIHFLIQEGVIKMSEDDYKKMVGVYQTLADSRSYENVEQIKEQLQIFNSILANMEVNPNAPRICLIGDELADRGANDYLTLKMLEKLSLWNVDVDITISNHSIEFIDPFEQKEKYTDRLGRRQATSCENLGKLIASKLVDSKEISDIVNNHYKKSVRALTYTLSADKKTITVFSHAGIGLDTIGHLAKSLGLIKAGTSYTPPKTAEELAVLIDQINDAFHEQYVKSDKMHTINRRLTDGKGYNIKPNEEPLTFLIWNREYKWLDRSSPDGYQFNFAHGHDPEQNPPQNVFMLDTLFGKPGYDETNEEPLIDSGIKYAQTNTILTTHGTARVLALSVDATLAQSEEVKIIKRGIIQAIAGLDEIKQKLNRYKGNLESFSADIKSDHGAMEARIVKIHERLSRWEIGDDKDKSSSELISLKNELIDVADASDALIKRMEIQNAELLAAQKERDKEKVEDVITKSNSLVDIITFIKTINDANPATDLEACRAAILKLGHNTSLDVNELKEFLQIARDHAFEVATVQTVLAVKESDDKENLMKLLLCDPTDFTNNSFKEALSHIVNNKEVIETLDNNKDAFNLKELLQTVRDNIREDILTKVENDILENLHEDANIKKLIEAGNDEETNQALKDLLGEELYKELLAVAPTDKDYGRLIETAKLVASDNKDIHNVIAELIDEIKNIKDVRQLDNLSTLLATEATFDNPTHRTALANLFKKNPDDQDEEEDPRIQQLVDAKINLQAWFGIAVKDAYKNLARNSAIEQIEKMDGKSADYANMLGQFIDANEIFEIDQKLEAIIGEELIAHLNFAEINPSELKEIAKTVLAPLAINAAMTQLDSFNGSAEDIYKCILALQHKGTRTREQKDIIDKVLNDPAKNLRKNLDASQCDQSPLIQRAQNILAPIAVAAAKQAVSAIAVTGAGYNPKELIDFIKSASSVPPDPTSFDKLKAIIDPALADQLKAANITDLAVIVTQARDKLYEYTSTILLDKLKTASTDDLTRLMNEPRTIHGVLASFREIINNISGIANFHETVQLIETGNINQLLDKLRPQALIVRTENAQKFAVDHIQKMTHLTILNELAKLDGNQFIDATQTNRLINLLGSAVDKFLPALIDANPKVKMDIIVKAAKQRMASLKLAELQENIALFQGGRDAMIRLHKEDNLTVKLNFLVDSGIVPRIFIAELDGADPNELKNAINESAKQWVIDNLIKSAKTFIDNIEEIDQLPVINSLTDLDRLGFSPEERMYLSDTTHLDRFKLVIEQRKEAIELATSTPSDNIAQIRDVREFIANRATISDLEALQTAVNAKDEAQCKVVLKRRGFSDESLSELKTADFDKLTSLIDTQLTEMKLQETAAKSAKYNLDHCDTELELAIRQQDAIQREYDTQLAIIDDETADEDALNDVDAKLEVLKLQLEEAKSKVAIARIDLNHARERFERADTIAKDKQNRLHQSELRHLEARSKQVEAKQEERERLIQSVTEANTGVTQATTAVTEAKRLLELAKVPKRPTESDAEFSARQSTISDLTTKHAEKERQLTEAKRIKTEADRALKDARATKSDTALQEELTAAKQTVVAHKNRQPPQTSDEPRKRTQRQLQEDDTVNQNASRTDLDARKREAEASLKKALNRESKLIARKAELETLLASNPSQSIKQAAQTELTQLKRALESVRKHINANEALIAGTIPTATKDVRKKLEVEAKLTEDEANTCMRDYKQANKYTNDKITIADHIRTNIMTKPQTLITLEKLADNYIVQLEYLAKRGHDENAKEELSSILDKSAKLHAQLEIYKDELNKEILYATADKEKLLATLQKVNTILMGLKKAQQAYHQPLAEVGSLCIISDPPICKTEDEINDQIANILGSSTTSSSGYLGSGVAKINTTETFKEAAGRVTKMELEDGRALRGGTFNAAVVQKSTPSGGFVTLFHVNDSDKARITGNTSLTAGAKLIEEHRLGNHHSSDPIDICGKFPPQMVKDMILYCEAKGYKYNNLTDTTFTPSAKKVSALQEKLDTEKVKTAIFGTAKELGTSKAKITALEKEIKLDETPVPTSTRPST